MSIQNIKCGKTSISPKELYLALSVLRDTKGCEH
jgi:hypothetical protein